MTDYERVVKRFVNKVMAKCEERIPYDEIANLYVEKLKPDFPNAHWCWTGKHNNEDGCIWIWDESDIRDNWEYAPAKYKMLDDGTIVPLITPIIEGVTKENVDDTCKVYRFRDRKWVVGYFAGIDVTSKSVFEMQRDGSYKLLYVNHLKGNVFSF